jgi:hypothetical protein
MHEESNWSEGEIRSIHITKACRLMFVLGNILSAICAVDDCYAGSGGLHLLRCSGLHAHSRLTFLCSIYGRMFVTEYLSDID